MPASRRWSTAWCGRRSARPGVLRPTTRAPVLVCHPADAAVVRREPPAPRAGPHLRPEHRSGLAAGGHRRRTSAAGLAFLDAPDIDSVVDSNRALATQLLAAADLWLFVTTAARYADAVPWDAAAHRAASAAPCVALVLDRVPTGRRRRDRPAPDRDAARQRARRRAAVRAARGLTSTARACSPSGVITPLRSWFDELASSAPARAAVVRQTVGGAIDALGPTVAGLADAADEQVAAADRRWPTRSARRTPTPSGPRSSTACATASCSAARCSSRWQELVGTGDLMRALQARVGRGRATGWSPRSPAGRHPASSSRPRWSPAW